MRSRSQTKASSVRWVAVLGAVGLLACAGPALAGQAGKEAPQIQGVQVHIDPATGQVRQPTAAEVRALSDAVRALFARSAQGVQVTEHADGSLSATLGPDSLNVWVATIDADGQLHQTCVEGANAAGALQGAPALEEK
jgi:hypothetical protein